MRTTIELKDSHRAALLGIAGRRGVKGFSEIIAEAVEAYLASHGDTGARRAALAVRGSLSAAEARDLERRTRAIREHWR